MQNGRRNDTNEVICKTETQSQTEENETLVARGEAWEAGIVREFGMDMDSGLHLTGRTSKDLLSSPGNSAQCHVAAGMGGELGREKVRVCGWLSPSAVCLKLSQHC